MEFLKRLFGNNPFLYVARPWHVVFYPPLLMAMGTATFVRDGWRVFGVSCFLLGLLLGLFIVFAIGWEKATQYWDKINEHIRLLTTIKDPILRNDIATKLGYKTSPDHITITERKEDDFGKLTGNEKYNTLPVAPALMQMLADTVLSGVSFSETEICEKRKLLSPRTFRSIQREWRKKKYLRANVIKNEREVPNQGYSFTKTGGDMLYEFASESVKLQLRSNLSKGG